MAESLPVVTVPGDDEALGTDSLSPEDIVELHEVVVEELPMVEFEGFDSIDTTPFAVVTEPSELSGEVVIVIGSSGEEEGEEEVEVVERGAERRGMATQSGIHPVTVPSEMPIDDVPPDETIPAFPVEGETASEAQNATVVEVGDGDDDVRVLNVEKVVVVEEVEVVDLAKEVEVVDLVKVVEVVDLVKEEVLTEEVTVKVSEVLLGKETVEEAMETEKGEKKRLREGEEKDEDASKKLKSEEEEKAAKKRLRDGEEEEAVKKLKSEEEQQDAKKLKSEEEEQDAKKLKSEEEEAGKKLKSEEEGKVVEPKKLGPKIFCTPVEMFSYFYNLLHDWNLNQNVNKYEFMVLSELVSQGNPQKVGNGIAAIQVRQHPKWQSRCYYVIHEDGSEDDFSYRKCCDALMPLPASLYRKNGELNLEKLFPGQKGRHHREQQQQNGGGRGGGRVDYRGVRGGGGGRFGGRGGGGRGGRGGGGRRGGRGRW